MHTQQIHYHQCTHRKEGPTAMAKTQVRKPPANKAKVVKAKPTKPAKTAHRAKP